MQVQRCVLPTPRAADLHRIKWLRRVSERWFAAGVVLVLSGCGALRGAPDSVIDASQERGDLALYLQGDVLQKSYSSNNADRGGMDATAWRDSVIAARIEIADQNYQVFKNELYAETSGINLGTNLAALALSGAASVAGAGTAQALAAASTGVLGAGTAFNKDALYEKTLPAIFAQMEANRTTVLLTIRKSQRNDATKYPLSLALSDISAYQRAGTLESAIQALTTSATNQADANKKELVGLTVLPAAVEARREQYSDNIQALFNKSDRTSLDNIANALGVARSADLKVEAANILIALNLKANGAQAASVMSDLCKQLMSISGQSC